MGPGLSTHTEDGPKEKEKEKEQQPGLVRASGFVGLSNQGATCYLNSCLQSLFMTPEFRAALFKWRYRPDLDGPEDECIAFQLQLLFAHLSLSDLPALETTGLTKAFGWTRWDSFQQHDVQELLRVLFDALEDTFKGSDLEKVLDQTYQGKMEDYITCTSCNHTSKRVDPFLDVQLVVRGASDLHQALDRYVEAETLSGGNQWTCEKCEKKVNARKGLRFTRFPYILTLHLRRFDFDYLMERRVKVNDRFIFPAELDVGDYLHVEEAAEKPKGKTKDEPSLEVKLTPERRVRALEQGTLYELYAVLVHAGGAMGGHYYVYIRSFADGNWYQFNDSMVAVATLDEVEECFGGKRPMAGGSAGHSWSAFSGFTAGMAPMRSANAYMLLYRRVDPTLNINRVPIELLPEGAMERVMKENAISRKSKDEADAKWKRKYDEVTINVVWCAPPDQQPRGALAATMRPRLIERSLRLSRSGSLRDATREAYDVLLLGKEQPPPIPLDGEEVTLAKEKKKTVETTCSIPLQCVRLRSFNVHREAPGLCWANEEASLTELQIYTGRYLLLEWKLPGSPWPVYDQSRLTLRVVLFDRQSKSTTGIPVHVVVGRRNETVAGLKAAVESAMGIPVAEQRLFDSTGFGCHLLTPDSSFLFRDHHIMEGAMLHVERVLPDEDKDDVSNSFVLAVFQEERHWVDVRFNKPDPTAPPPSAPTTSGPIVAPTVPEGEQPIHHVRVDVRDSVGTLKEAMARVLEMPPSQFNLSRQPGGSQLKDMTASLDSLFISHSSVLFVEVGSQLTVDEYQFAFHLYSARNGATCALFTMPLMGGWTWGEVAVKVHEKMAAMGKAAFKFGWEKKEDEEGEEPCPPLPPVTQMRLRERVAQRTLGPLSPTMLVRDSYNYLYDGRVVAVQWVAEDEVVDIPPTQILLALQPWDEATRALGPREEVAVSAEISLSTFLALISAKTGLLPADAISICRPVTGAYSVDAFAVLRATWIRSGECGNPETCTLRKALTILSHGDVICYQPITKEAAASGQSGSSVGKAGPRRPEVALKIRKHHATGGESASSVEKEGE